MLGEELGVFHASLLQLHVKVSAKTRHNVFNSPVKRKKCFRLETLNGSLGNRQTFFFKRYPIVDVKRVESFVRAVNAYCLVTVVL